MKKLNVKDLSTGDLREKLSEERSTYTKLKMNHAVSPVENPLKIRATRRNIARFETELRQRAAEAQATNKE
jgi:large subunit ribosomal protein L29